MKILLTNFHVGRGGGHATYILAIARALASRYGIYVATPATSGLYQEACKLPGVTVVPMDFPGKVTQLGHILRVRRQLKELIVREGIDVLHVNGSSDHRLAMYATRGLGARRPRIVFTKHNSLRVGTGPANKLRASIATDHVIAVSEYTAARMRETPYGRCGVTVVKNGVDLDRFAPVGEQTARERRLELIGPRHAGKLVIGTVIGFEWYKGSADMMAAIAALPPPLREQIHVVVAGLAPDAKQWAQIDELGLRDMVTVAGLVADVRPYIAAFDVGFVLSHAVETISFACREMMAMGKPVIVSRYAGLPENIDDGVDGWIVPARAPGELARRLADIVARRAELPAMGRRARDKAEREFSDRLFIEGTAAVYERLAAATAA